MGVLSTSSNDREGSANDPRRQLIERIVATEPFRKSARFRDLLRYLVEKALEGQPENLTETKIGHAVFGKSRDYSPTDDSAVRVHVRQLRLKLHEYFDTVGRDEALIVEIPKGGFMPVFQDKSQRTSAASPTTEPTLEVPVSMGKGQPKRLLIPCLSILAILFGLTSLLLFRKLQLKTANARPPWPLSTMVDSDFTTTIVTADVNYGMSNLLYSRQESLQEYLSSGIPKTPTTADASVGEKALFEYIDKSSLTSSSDAVIAAKLANMVGFFHGHVNVRSAHDLRPRDFDLGSYIFLGSPASNPWVSEFQNQLNFQEIVDIATHAHVWKNKSPRPGELSEYRDISETGASGDDYADIALLPSRSGQGAVLLLQGGQQEGTESTLAYLDSATKRDDLIRALGLSGLPNTTVYFEALIKTRVIAGAPGSSVIVATRIIHPQS